MAGTAVAQRTSGIAPQQTKTPAKAAAIPFPIASRRKFALGPAMPGPSMSTTVNQNLGPVEITPTGFLRFLKLTLQVTTAANAATVVFAPDAPFNALQFVTLTNASGDTIIVPIDGYMLYCMNKYGALSSEPPWNDPRSSPIFLATAGAGATGGSFRFSLRIPLEIDPETAFGAVASMASNKTLQLGAQVAPTTLVYTTAPTTPGVISPVMYQAFWAQPKGDNGRGIAQQTSPDGNNSLMQWRLETPTVTAGDKLIKFNNIGNVFRMFLLFYRTAAGARTSADIPALHTFRLNNDEMQYLPDLEWQEDMVQNYGYIVTGPDVAQSLDTGVRAYPYFMASAGRVRTSDPREQYLPTLDTTLFQYRGTSFGGAMNTLQILSCEIKPTTSSALYQRT